MTDAFTDVLDEDNGDGDDTATETVTDGITFRDAVRSTLPDPDGTRATKRYSDPEGDNEADDVDARGLFRTPTLNELRYYAREGPYGKTIIRKPITDAFKHGYAIEGDQTSGDGRNDSDGVIAEFLDEYEDYYRLAEIKSRRDGMAILMHVITDSAESASEPIPSGADANPSWQGFQLWTLDNLSDDIGEAEAADHVEYDQDQLYVSEGDENGGVVVVDDIGHPDHGDIVGYGIEPRNDEHHSQMATFVHADRCQHFVWGEHVDGPLKNDLHGRQIGESVLTPVLRPIIATQMGYWALQNILFRYSAPLHAVEPPESWGQDDFDEAREKLDDLSMSSDAVLPPGSELSVAEGVSEFDPSPVYDTLVESICAGSVFTKSVLQGTQTGTVSGSETDIKGYFSEVHIIREQRMEAKMREAVEMVASYDQSTIPRAVALSNWTIDWGPLFRPTNVEQAQGAVSLVTGLTSAIKQYTLTPDEARSILQEEWAEFDIDISLDELSEDDWDELDRINLREAGMGPGDDEPDVRQNPRLQNGGGQPEGQTRESSQPARTTGDSMTDEEMDQIASLVAQKLSSDGGDS